MPVLLKALMFAAVLSLLFVLPIKNSTFGTVLQIHNVMLSTEDVQYLLKIKILV